MSLDQYPNQRPSRSVGRRSSGPGPTETQYVTDLRRTTESPSLMGMFQAVFRKNKVGSEEVDSGMLGLLSSGFGFRSRDARVIGSTWAARGTVVPNRDGLFLVITDQPILFVSIGGAWKPKAGRWRGNYADLPTPAADDAELLAEILDYDHVLRWSGSAWGWGFGNPSPSGIYGLFETAPSTAGWQLCNGATVARLNADGTTTNVTVPDVTTPRYMKAALTAAAVAAAGGTSANTTPTNQSATTGITVDDHPAHTHDDASSLATPDLFAPDVTGTGVAGRTGNPSATLSHTVNDAGHNHIQDAHNHGVGTLEPASKQAILYYRR
jgi:hypothetical protein